MKQLLISLAFLAPFSVDANVTCEGVITDIYKWDHFETISILVEGTTRWISMPSKSDESMALMAFAAGKSVVVQWEDASVNTCSDGWDHNKKLIGWWRIKSN